MSNKKSNPFRNPEKPQKLPVKTATLDKAVIDRIAQYYIRNGLEFEEKEVRRIYSLHSFRVLATYRSPMACQDDAGKMDIRWRHGHLHARRTRHDDGVHVTPE